MILFALIAVSFCAVKTKIGGVLHTISSRSDDGDIWGAQTYGNVYHSVDGSKWNKIYGHPGLIQVSQGADGEVWGVDPDGGIYRYKGANSWEKIHGFLTQVAVGSASEIWGVNDITQRVYHYLGNGAWDRLGGILLSQISVNSYGEVYGVNDNSDVYRYDGNNQWTLIHGVLAHVEVGEDGSVIGFQNSGRYYQLNVDGATWTRIDPGVSDPTWLSVYSKDDYYVLSGIDDSIWHVYQ